MDMFAYMDARDKARAELDWSKIPEGYDYALLHHWGREVQYCRHNERGCSRYPYINAFGESPDTKFWELIGRRPQTPTENTK